jgi:hypothetical protein
MPIDGFAEMTPLQQYILLGAASLELEGHETFQSYDVRDYCVDNLDRLNEDPFEGGITREAVIRALSKLEGQRYVETEFDERSPVGKGRPNYRLAVDTDPLLDELAELPLFADLAADVEA